MRIVIAGGSGHLGTILAREFHGEHEVVVLGRSRQLRPWRTEIWDGETIGPWAGSIDGADVVVNLAGRSVNCRYNETNREEIVRSRVASTRIIGEAITRSSHPPALWLQASTATIYAHRYDAPNDEEHGVIGGTEAGVPETWRFSIDVARQWERAADEAPMPRTRLVKMRTAIVMSPERGGAFDLLLRLVRMGLGGRAGDGLQFVSWIHHRDFVRAIRFIMAKPFVDGPVNIAAPKPLPNAEFMRALREAWGVRAGLAANRRLLEIGSFFLRTETELILKSRRVVPARLLRYGFCFEHPGWEEAAQILCDEWRALHEGGTPTARGKARW
ncbi:MAG TPA: TIGR01777 family oxidoreductase [Thermoanaerobaculia bacterium]|nr:TIGR01777 family oxidoreductase [Thermoanaerobaculia bacterium]